MSDYQELAPPADLGQYVECFWFRRSAAGNSTSHRVLPDGCMDIILNFSDAGNQVRNRDRAFVVGAMTRSISVPIYGREDFFGVRFRPGMASHILQLPAAEITDKTVALDDVFNRETSSLVDRLFEQEPRERAAMLGQFLRRRLEKTDHTDHRAKFVVDSIVKSCGRISISEICSAAGVSRQHLARLFHFYVGVSPKLLCRIFRFRSVLREIRSEPGMDWVDAAAKLGYYDQPHLILDFKEFSGTTPSDYFRAV